jgi:hypothetical protein
MNVSPNFTEQLFRLVEDVSLNYALESDDAFVDALKAMRLELAARYDALYPGARKEVGELVVEVLTVSAIHRHTIITHAGQLAPRGLPQ